MRFEKGFLGKFGENFFCWTDGHLVYLRPCPATGHIATICNLVKNKKFNLYRLTSNLFLLLKSYLNFSLLAADYFLFRYGR